MSNFYEILGVTKSASEEDIKKAYRKKAREHHPDRNPGNAEAEKKFKLVQEAYETLSDKQKKSYYDQFGGTRPQGGGFRGGAAPDFDFSQFGGFADIFESFFGGEPGTGSRGGRRKAGPERGMDIEAQIQIKFEEAVFGTSKTLEITKPETCSHCKGEGREPGTSVRKCETCAGQGQVKATRQTILGQISSVQLCPQCLGQGEIPEKVCTKCSGQGRVRETQEITVKIPKGIEDGATIRLKGKGAAGTKGGEHGDLFLHIRVAAHPKFSRDGKNIYSEETLHVLQAVLGDTVQIETIHGKAELKIPAGTQSGTPFTLKTKGAPSLKSDKQGDHIVVLHFKTPEKLSRKEKELYEALAAEGKLNLKGDSGFFGNLFGE
ncbi:MAG: molecular chaperone DnaJ [Patescibacteria group bacterium]